MRTNRKTEKKCEGQNTFSKLHWPKVVSLLKEMFKIFRTFISAGFNPLLTLQIRLLVFLFAFHHVVLYARGKDVVPEGTSIPPFIAEGIVSCVGFQSSATNTIAVSKTEGRFLFSYTNGVWEVQFTFQIQSNNYVGLQPSRDIAGTMISIRSIPDGIREIISYSSNAIPSGADMAKTHPSALARTNSFPEWSSQQLFLPWLSLCPNAKLPLVNSNLMRVHFESELLNNPKNIGKFKISYIEPENGFISLLTVTNNGILFLADGSTIDLPDSYKSGYPQFSYEVLETTNCNGVTFPLAAALCQFAPSSTAPSSKDIYPAVISRIHIEQIDVFCQHLALIPTPADVVALDSRPSGLNNGVTVNYNVKDDQWNSITNERIRQLSSFIKRQPFNNLGEEQKYSRNRIVILCIFGVLTIVPLIGILLRNKNQPSKQK